MANKLSKNAEKAGVGTLVVAAATLVVKAGETKGYIPADMQPYAVTLVSGVLLGAMNFIKYSIREAVARRKARRR